MALAWVLGRPAVSSVIVAARKPEQLEDNIQRRGPSALRGGCATARRRSRTQAFPIRSGWSFSSTPQKTRVQKSCTPSATWRTDVGRISAEAGGPAKSCIPEERCSRRAVAFPARERKTRLLEARRDGASGSTPGVGCRPDALAAWRPATIERREATTAAGRIAVFRQPERVRARAKAACGHFLREALASQDNILRDPTRWSLVAAFTHNYTMRVFGSVTRTSGWLAYRVE